MDRKSLFLIGIVVFIVGVAPCLGNQLINPFGDLSTTEATILTQLRLPRVALGFIAGAVLGICGVVVQSLFRNILASPFTLGVSSGAALGATVYILMGSPLLFLGFGGTALFGLAGALITILLLWLLGRGFSLHVETVLLCGVILSFFYSSLIMLIQYLGDFAEVFKITHWMLGSVEVVGFERIVYSSPFILVGLALLLLNREELNLLSLGEEMAMAKGVAVQRAAFRLLFGVSVLVGVIVSVCGPIPFVGMMVPFFCRGLVGYDHNKLLVASIFIGGSFLVICDTVARTAFAPVELPVGVITALLGGPCFLWMLLAQRAR